MVSKVFYIGCYMLTEKKIVDTISQNIILEPNP